MRVLPYCARCGTTERVHCPPTFMQKLFAIPYPNHEFEPAVSLTDVEGWRKYMGNKFEAWGDETPKDGVYDLQSFPRLIKELRGDLK